MKLTYKKKLFLYFFIVFVLFTTAIVILQHAREKKYKVEALQSSLDTYTLVIEKFIEKQKNEKGLSVNQINDYPIITSIMPRELRITIVDNKGNVIYDDNEELHNITDNHLDRPEIAKANIKGFGTTVRKSESTGIDYFYLATASNDYFIRVALPYDVKVQNLLKSDNLYIYFILALFIVVFFSLLFLSDRFGRALSMLRDFAYSIGTGSEPNNVIFPDGELGEIGEKIFDNYREINKKNDEIKREKEKLLLHFSHSSEGIAFFSPKFKTIYSNSHFISFLNLISDEPTTRVEDLFSASAFHKAFTFIKENKNGSHIPYEEKISRSGQYFTLRVMVFEDQSIEVILNNVTSSEKNRILKQEMTNNIAHELRTPVSSIRGYMETLIEQDNIAPDKMRHFIERSYHQVVRLSDLIRDISIITKLEESPEQIVKEPVNVCIQADCAISELKDKAEHMGSTIINDLPKDMIIEGNATLIFSIFRNLIDNGLSYAGDNVTIKISCHMSDEKYYYISVSDNGKGISEEHLTRIFDRFYRTHDGRSRQSGGSGLGLSIVKNSILFHKGNVSAKNLKSGGLEILFSLKK